MSIPALTGQQMAEVDRVMVESLGLDVLQLMEVAGRQVAAFARSRFLGGDARGKRVLVLCGSGGNGGDGLVAARHLHGWGAEVTVLLGRVPRSGAAAHQLAVWRAMGQTAADPALTPLLPKADLIIDALLGFSLSGAPTGETAALIHAANAHPAPTLAVDLPSGMDATSGIAFDPCIRADATLTLALPKSGLLTQDAIGWTGDLHLADIGVPLAAYAQLGHDIGPIFAESEFIRIR